MVVSGVYTQLHCINTILTLHIGEVSERLCIHASNFTRSNFIQTGLQIHLCDYCRFNTGVKCGAVR